jgi:hypothetical protein
MPKADATGLAPKNRLSSPPRSGPPAEGFSVAPGWGGAGAQPPHLTGARAFGGQPERNVRAAFFGKTSERRPWATKREDRRAAVARRSELTAAGFTNAVRSGAFPPPGRRATPAGFCAGRSCPSTACDGVLLPPFSPAWPQARDRPRAAPFRTSDSADTCLGRQPPSFHRAVARSASARRTSPTQYPPVRSAVRELQVQHPAVCFHY